jgi:nucleoside 2-deoxyribosyltransferase
MIVNYSHYHVIHDNSKPSIFLAGPTPRSKDIISWRKEAINILEQLNFNGIVYVPECEFTRPGFDYTTQVEWEWEAMEAADIIVFWIPRSEELPGFTTNVEFGYWLAKNKYKVYYGRPADSIKNKYLDKLYAHVSDDGADKKPFETLDKLLYHVVNILNMFKHTIKLLNVVQED